MTFRIQPMALPADPLQPGADGELFRRAMDLQARCNDAAFGPGNMTLTLSQSLTAYRGRREEAVEAHLLLDDEHILGLAALHLPQSESTDVVDTILFVDPSVIGTRRRAAFSELVDLCLRRADQLGRGTVFGGGAAGPGTGLGDDAVTAASGAGCVRLDDPESSLWHAHGATLSQVYRYSVLTLDEIDDIDARLAEAALRSGGYRPVAWKGETPPRHRRGMRALHERMSTDVPLGDLELEPEVWTDARLAEFEQHKMGGGRQLLTAAAEHVGTGELVGYTQMLIGDDPVGRQHNLIVLREHRGHGLGMLLKLAGIRLLRAAAPQAQRIGTMNAEENRHMLRVNERVGFTPVAWTAVWQLKR